MSNYDSFASFYDTIMGDRSDVTGIIRAQIKRYMPDTQTILELGCGTGSIIADLASNFEVAGIDLSAQMLKIAQRKLPNSTLLVADITSFEMNTKFDVCICVFDTINHLASLNDWRQTFARGYEHLNDGGLFIFDMISIGRINLLMALPTLTQTADGATVAMELSRAGTNSIDWYITIEQPTTDGMIQTYEDTARETGYSLHQVSSAVTAAGFELLATFNPVGREPTDDSDRVYYVCRRI